MARPRRLALTGSAPGCDTGAVPSLERGSAAVRLATWLAAAAVGTAVLADARPGVLFVLTLLPAAVLVLWVRTWWGTALAGVGFVVVVVGMAAAIDESGETSSTAGLGLLWLPVLPLAVVVPVALVEGWVARRDQARV